MNIFHCLVLSAALFTIGTIGVIVKKNIISIFLCIELMLNAVNLTFMAFSKYLNQVNGQVFVFFIMVVAAAEAATCSGCLPSVSFHQQLKHCRSNPSIAETGQ